jgi:GT2 family glycosyltransferase
MNLNKPLRIEVLILTLNDVEDTKECLKCYNEIKNRNLDLNINLIDNGSDSIYAEQLSRICEKLDINYIRNKTNLGFAPALAKVLPLINKHYDYLLLSNNDIVFDCIQLEQFIFQSYRNKSSISSPVITYYPNTDIIWQEGGYVNRMFLHLRMPMKNKRLSEIKNLAPREVDFVSGCIMLISHDHIEKAGFLDSTFFYSVEDLDYCLRVSPEDKILIIPDSVIHHKVASTSGGWNSFFSVYHNVLGRTYLSTKQHNFIKICSFLYLIFIFIPVKAWKVRKTRNVFSVLPILYKSSIKIWFKSSTCRPRYIKNLLYPK